MRAAWSETHLEAIRKNVKYLKNCISPETLFMGVIKADAYGHGAVPVAKVLAEEGVDSFGVALVSEGIELRQAGYTLPILVLGQCFENEYNELIEYNLIPSISTVEQAEMLNMCATTKGKQVKIHIKVDTGMGRLGFLAKDADITDKIKKICDMSNIEVEGIFSHFATSAQTKDTNYCEMQFELFMNVIAKLSEKGINIPIKHIANSGATILFPHMHLDMVRPGTAIYGLYAGEDLMEIPDYKVYPAMEIKSKLAFIKEVPIGTKVSYTGSFEAKRNSVLGIIPLGYVDGIFRNLANRGSVLIHGKRCSMVGNICMDQFVVDITDIENPSVGDEVVIVGKQGDEYISAEEIGGLAGTISIEVLCGLGKRMPLKIIK